MKKQLIALLVVLVLVATACGGDDEADGVASLEDIEPTASVEATNTTTDGQIDTEQAMLNFTQCLRDEGLDIQDPEIDADGGFNFRQLAEGAGDIDQEALRAGFEACQSELEGITLRGGGIDRTAIQDTLIEYAACMRDNGYDMEDPDLSNFGPGSGEGEGQPGQGGGPFGEIDPEDPDFIAANEACQGIFINAVPRFLGGEGGNPGGEG